MIAVLSTLALSIVLGGLYLKLARRWHFLDRPNERSSHKQPVANGGGLAILVALLAGYCLAAPWRFEYNWLLAMVMLLMLVGVLDDWRGLSVRLRFASYSLVAVATSVALLQSVVVLASPSGLALALLLAFAMLWAMNLYNFMDGTDGIAATQCALACGAAALLADGEPDRARYALLCLLLGAAHLGFLAWNTAPARLFMGDAGSVPTGFLLAALAVHGSVNKLLPFGCWVILLAAFITDASWTLLWRLFNGQRIFQAHRSHAYQKLSRHWNSHQAVVLLLLGLNVCWLIPLAWAVDQWPAYTLYFVILAYIPLLIGMAKVGKLT